MSIHYRHLVSTETERWLCLATCQECRVLQMFTEPSIVTLHLTGTESLHLIDPVIPGAISRHS